MSVFSGAKNVVVNGGSIVANAGSTQSFDKLVAEVAPNAILNAGGRADEVRCFPGTREEVIGRLEEFMDDNNPGRKRMMWLSGPAGAGKSAICQTVAERRSEQGRQAANFFFFRGDSTRSYSRPLVATLVYQLRCFYPALDELLSDCLQKDPLICSMSIERQIRQLILSPLQTIRQSTPIQEHIAIIIDGLDECSNNERDHDQILIALHSFAHADHSPFVILVASRAEPHLVMSFNRLGSSVESIFLNEEYQPQQDIRLFVVAKFAEIKKNHHLARTLSAGWPTDADIDAIVDKSSGQFIYGATVMRYIQLSSSSPALSLVTILEMGPSPGNHNPLAHLDAIYSYIFSKVLNIHTVKLILCARNCATISLGAGITRPRHVPTMIKLAGYDLADIASFFADLVSIIKFVTTKKGLLQFYHASLDDYLNNKSRSTIYCVNEEEIAAELSSMCLRYISEARNISDADSIMLVVKPLSMVHKSTPELSKSLFDASTKRLDGQEGELSASLSTLIGHIERLYWKHDKAQFKALLQSWSRFVSINRIEGRMRGVVRAQDPSADLYYKQYWMSEGDGQRKMLKPPNFAPVGKAGSNTQTTSTRASPNAATDGAFRDSSIYKLGGLPPNIPAAPSKGQGGNSLPADTTRSSTLITPTRTSPNTTIGGPVHSLSVPKLGAPLRNILLAPPKSSGDNPAPAGISSLRSNNPVTHARSSSNATIGGSARRLSVRNPFASPQNTLAAPFRGGRADSLISRPGSTSHTISVRRSSTSITSARSSPRNVPVPLPGRGGGPAPAAVSRSNTSITPASASSNATIGSSARSFGVRETGASLPNTRSASHKSRGGGSLISQPGSTSRTISTYKKEKGYGRMYDDRPYELSTIRVKLHYQDDIRVMLSYPDTPFSEFIDKIAAKFGKDFDELITKFRDKDGDQITLHDDSDYEHAIETVWQTSKGKAEGALEIWCQDIVR